MKKIIIIFLLLIFDISHVDSNCDKYLLSYNDIFDEKKVNIYFVNMNSLLLNDVLNQFDIEVNYYIIDNKKYYARNIKMLESNYLKDKKIDEKVYYENNGFLIDGINITCSFDEYNLISKFIHIY